MMRKMGRIGERTKKNRGEMGNTTKKLKNTEERETSFVEDLHRGSGLSDKRYRDKWDPIRRISMLHMSVEANSNMS